MLSSWIHEKKSSFIDEEETVIALQLKLILNILVPQIFPQHSVHVLRLKLLFVIIRNNECNCSSFILCNCTHFGSTLELQTSKAIKKHRKKIPQRIQKIPLHFALSFCLMMCCTGFVLFTSLQAWCVYTRSNYWCLEISHCRISLWGTQPSSDTQNPVLAIDFSCPPQKVITRFPAQDNMLAGWLHQQCFCQGRQRPPGYSGVQQ